MIVLGIIGEFLTVAGSFAISFNAGLNALLEISNNGYKIDEVKVDEAGSLVLTDVTLKKRKFGKTLKKSTCALSRLNQNMGTLHRDSYSFL